MENLISIGARLREVRKELGLTQAEFSAIAKNAGTKGVTRQSQSNYEKGEQSPSVEYLAAIAAAGADVEYILTGQPRAARQKAREVRRATDVVFEAMRQALGISQPALAEIRKQVLEGHLSATEGLHLLQSALLGPGSSRRPPPGVPASSSVHVVDPKEIELLKNYEKCTEEGKFAIEKAALGISEALHKDALSPKRKQARKGGA